MKSEIQGQYAGALTRGIAFLIDLFLIAVTLAVSTWLISSTIGLVGIDVQDCPDVLHNTDLVGIVCVSTRIGLAIYAAFFTPLYALFFWTFGGQTLGMGVMGIRVVRTDGKALTIMNSLRRILGFALCVFTLGIGFMKILIDNQREGLHDSLAGTYVIYAWRGEQNTAAIEHIRTWMARRKKKGKGKPTPADSH